MDWRKAHTFHPLRRAFSSSESEPPMRSCTCICFFPLFRAGGLETRDRRPWKPSPISQENGHQKLPKNLRVKELPICSSSDCRRERRKSENAQQALPSNIRPTHLNEHPYTYTRHTCLNTFSFAFAFCLYPCAYANACTPLRAEKRKAEHSARRLQLRQALLPQHRAQGRASVRGPRTVAQQLAELDVHPRQIRGAGHTAWGRRVQGQAYDHGV